MVKRQGFWLLWFITWCQILIQPPLLQAQHDALESARVSFSNFYSCEYFPDFVWKQLLPLIKQKKVFYFPSSSILVCYGLNGCIPPKLMCWNSNPQWEILTLQVGSLGVIRSWGWSPHEEDWCPYKRDAREISYPFHHVRTQQEGYLWTRKQISLDTESARTLTLHFPAFTMMRSKVLLFTSHPTNETLL